MTECYCSRPNDCHLPCPINPSSATADPTSLSEHHSDLASCVKTSRPSSPSPSAAVPSTSSPTASTSSSPSFSARYALARRRRECRGLLESLRLSMNLSLKAITLLFCCVIMTVQYRAQHRRRATAASSSEDSQQSSSSASSAFSSLFASSSKSAVPTLYQRLAVSDDATAEEIRTAHRRMAMRYHPDKLLAAHCTASSTSASEQSGESDSSGHDMFIAIQEAYEVLSDPYERKRYDCALMTGLTYTRLSSTLRNVHGRAEKQQEEQAMPPCPAYIRRRPAAFTSTAHSADFHESNRSSSRSSSSSSSTPKPVRASRSFSSIFRSPFLHVSPAPSTASTSGTGSPPYHSPASSPSTPPSSPNSSFSFLSSPSVTPPTTAANNRTPATAAEAVGTLSSLLTVLFADVQNGVSSVICFVTARLLMLFLFPLRVALALIAVVAEKRRWMAAERERMKEEEGARRRRVRDEVSVGMYGWRTATTDVR